LLIQKIGFLTMNKTVLITGASSGIGLELARIFAKNNTNLVLVARSENKLNSLADEIRKLNNVKIKIVSKDLSDLKNCELLETELKNEKITIDYLVNNAGFGTSGFFTDTDLQKEIEMINLNITALTYLTKIYAKEMKQRGSGRIMNVSSTAAFQPGPLMAVYYATKAYVQSFSEAIANELKGSGVTVTSLCPGPTESGFQDAADINNTILVKGRKLPTSAEVASYGYKAMMNGKIIAVHGLLNKIGAQSYRFAPRKVIVSAIRRIQATR
jgi:short-subunit dehydrogenase